VRPLRLAAVALMLWGCGESTTAPGDCPDYCPPARLEVVDTVLQGVFTGEEWFRGYIQPYAATSMEVVSTGTEAGSRAVIRFTPFSSEITIGGELVPVSQTDSFRLRLQVLRRTTEVTDLELLVYRLPITVDSTSGWDDVAPYFADSTLLASIIIPPDSFAPTDSTNTDSVSVAVDTIGITLPPSAFPNLEADSFATAVGLAVRIDQAAYVDLGAREGTFGASYMSWFVKVDSSGTAVDRTESRVPGFDSFIVADQPTVGDDVLAVGGVPSARAFLRIDLPDEIMKFSNIVRADLLLVPAAPVMGGPGDTVSVAVFAVDADIGPKSKPQALPSDSIARGYATPAVGSVDTVRIDITTLLLPMQADSTRPRTMLLRVIPEGSTLGQLLFRSSSSAVARPALHLTYVPFFTLEEPLP
jgi:hypothetical protein